MVVAPLPLLLLLLPLPLLPGLLLTAASLWMPWCSWLCCRSGRPRAPCPLLCLIHLQVAPTDIEEGMRVGVDRQKYQIQVGTDAAPCCDRWRLVALAFCTRCCRLASPGRAGVGAAPAQPPPPLLRSCPDPAAAWHCCRHAHGLTALFSYAPCHSCPPLSAVPRSRCRPRSMPA